MPRQLRQIWVCFAAQSTRQFNTISECTSLSLKRVQTSQQTVQGQADLVDICTVIEVPRVSTLGWQMVAVGRLRSSESILIHDLGEAEVRK
ncbi:hypothetical protein D3C77_521530 [compost metagenome]